MWIASLEVDVTRLRPMEAQVITLQATLVERDS